MSSRVPQQIGVIKTTDMSSSTCGDDTIEGSLDWFWAFSLDRTDQKGNKFMN